MNSSRARTDAELFDPLLTSNQVAAIFRVDPKTVTRWAQTGRLRGIRTPGGRHRFRESAVRELFTATEELSAEIKPDPIVIASTRSRSLT